MVADGTYDAYWERRLCVWDAAAGAAPHHDPADPARSHTPDPQALPLQQLLHRLAGLQLPAQAGQAPRYLDWIQASVGTAIQMIPVAEVLFFVSDEKYTRVQTPALEEIGRAHV